MAFQQAVNFSPRVYQNVVTRLWPSESGISVMQRAHRHRGEGDLIVLPVIWAVAKTTIKRPLPRV